MTDLSQTDIPTGPPTPNSAEKQKILNRLRRLEGQVRGLHRMVDENRDCQEILTLLAGIRSALDSTGDAVLMQYLERCQQQGQPLSAADLIRVTRLLR